MNCRIYGEKAVKLIMNAESEWVLKNRLIFCSKALYALSPGRSKGNKRISLNQKSDQPRFEPRSWDRVTRTVVLT